MAVDPARINSLLLAASKLDSPAERAAYLDRECGGEVEFRSHVEALLRANDTTSLPGLDATDVVATIDADPREPIAGVPSQDEQAGAVIAGKYTLVKVIGEGGMGSVWQAKQTEPVKRLVAIKLIKAGMDSKQVLARFDAERQALAMMDHPHIAKVLDGGLHQHRPYFVMELVEGMPITKFCDAGKLPIRKRLELFVSVCDAIQHAHQKGIIHRDIKPGNVLVAHYDDKPAVKVIDFGVAKATGTALTEQTLDTGLGGVVGTPVYMSPEQATFSNLDIDTRSDVYALGVLLYELLTGSPPFAQRELEKRGLLEMLRVIREDEPPRPSTKLSNTDSLATVSADRNTNPKNLTDMLRNELDWIVMKALEKDRARRYETANGFAADVRRYQTGEAVQAHPPSSAYRLKKFVRRNKGQVVAASLVVLTLLAGVIGTSLGLLEARRQEQLVRTEATAKGQALDAEKKQRDKAEKSAREAIAARNRESAQRDRAEQAYARTADVLDSMVSEVTGDSLATQKTISEEQKKFLTEVLTYYQEFVEFAADDETARRRTARAAHQVGTIEYRLGRNEESLAANRKARDGYASLAADFPVEPEYRRELADCHNSLGVLLMNIGKGEEAEGHYLEAVVIQEKLVADFPAIPDYRRLLANSLLNLGNLLRSQAKGPEAVEKYRQALASHEKLVADFPADPDHRHNLASCQHNLATMLSELGQQWEAEEQYRAALASHEKLAAEFPSDRNYRAELAMNHAELGNLLVALKRPEAEEQFRKALAIGMTLAAEFSAVPDYRRSLSFSHSHLGTLLMNLGRGPEAEEQLGQALDIRKKLAVDFPTVPENRRLLAISHMNLGNLLSGQGENLKAEEQYRQALAINEGLTVEFPAVPDYRWELANTYNALGRLLKRMAKLPQAEELFHQALPLQEKLAEEYPARLDYRQDLAMSYTNLSELMRDNGRRLDAEELSRLGLDIWEKLAAEFPANPKYRQALAVTYSNRGILLATARKQSEAEEQFRRALDIQEQLVTEFPDVPAYRQELARSHMNLGKLLNMRPVGLWNLMTRGGKKGEVEEQYRKALNIQEELATRFPAVPEYRGELAMTHNNLGILLADRGDGPEAEEQYRLAMDIQEQLASDFPDVPAYGISLGGSYCNFGKLVLSGEKPSDSLQWFAKAVRTLTPIYERDPSNATARQFLESSHSGRAIIHGQLHQHAEAVADWDKVIELSPNKGAPPIIRSVRAASLVRSGQVAEAVAEVAELTQTPFSPPDLWYNFACVYAIASDKIADKQDEYGDRAMTCLKKAVQGGFKDADHIANDTDLDSLRDREDFKKLVESLQPTVTPNDPPAGEDAQK